MRLVWGTICEHCPQSNVEKIRMSMEEGKGEDASAAGELQRPFTGRDSGSELLPRAIRDIFFHVQCNVFFLENKTSLHFLESHFQSQNPDL